MKREETKGYQEIDDSLGDDSGRSKPSMAELNAALIAVDKHRDTGRYAGDGEEDNQSN